MAIKLKPCPFCGGAAQYFEERIFIMGNASLIGVKCTKCGGAYMTSDKDKCPNDVFRAWNQRVGEVTVNQYGDDGEILWGKLLDALANAKTIVPAEGGTEECSEN